MTKCHKCTVKIPESPYRIIIPTVNDRTNRKSDRQYCVQCYNWYASSTSIDLSRFERVEKYFEVKTQ